MVKTSVSIVIPNWNGQALLKENLPFVFRSARKYGPVTEVIVVDDASQDDSCKMLGNEFPEVNLITHTVNKGFGQACFSGILEATGEIVILLNSDIQREEAFIEPVIDSFSDGKTFCSSPLTLDETGEICEQNIRIPYLSGGQILFRSFPVQRLLSPKQKSWYTLFASGSALAMDRELFLNFGGFDELYAPFYYEDADLGMMAWRRGFFCKVIPESRVVHFRERTIARSFKTSHRAAIRQRNRLLFHFKHLTSLKDLSTFAVCETVHILQKALLLQWADFVGLCLSPGRIPLALKRRHQEGQDMKRSEEEILRIIGEAADANLEI